MDVKRHLRHEEKVLEHKATKDVKEAYDKEEKEEKKDEKKYEKKKKELARNKK